jgi:hypothetical protein
MIIFLENFLIFMAGVELSFTFFSLFQLYILSIMLHEGVFEATLM